MLATTTPLELRTGRTAICGEWLCAAAAMRAPPPWNWHQGHLEGSEHQGCRQPARQEHGARAGWRGPLPNAFALVYSEQKKKKTQGFEPLPCSTCLCGNHWLCWGNVQLGWLQAADTVFFWPHRSKPSLPEPDWPVCSWQPRQLGAKRPEPGPAAGWGASSPSALGASSSLFALAGSAGFIWERPRWY